MSAQDINMANGAFTIILVNLMSRSALDFDSEKNVERGIPASWSVDVLI